MGSRGGFPRNVLEAVSGSVTMDGTALGPPGQSLGPRGETEKRTLRPAGALVPGNPLTSHRGCFLQTSPAEAPPPGGWNPGCPWAVRGALFLPFPPAGGCQGRPHSPGAPRTRVGRAWLREPPPMMLHKNLRFQPMPALPQRQVPFLFLNFFILY